MESDHFLGSTDSVRSRRFAVRELASHANGGDVLRPFAALGYEMIHLNRCDHPRMVLNVSLLQKTTVWLCDFVS